MSPVYTSVVAVLHSSGFISQKKGGTYNDDVIKLIKFVLMTSCTLGSFASPLKEKYESPAVVNEDGPAWSTKKWIFIIN